MVYLRVEFRQPFGRQRGVAALGGNAARADELDPSVNILENRARISRNDLLLGQTPLAFVGDALPPFPALLIKIAEKKIHFDFVEPVCPR